MPTLQAHPSENSAFLLDQVQRGIELDDAALIQHNQPIVIDNLKFGV